MRDCGSFSYGHFLSLLNPVLDCVFLDLWVNSSDISIEITNKKIAFTGVHLHRQFAVVNFRCNSCNFRFGIPPLMELQFIRSVNSMKIFHFLPFFNCIEQKMIKAVALNVKFHISKKWRYEIWHSTVVNCVFSFISCRRTNMKMSNNYFWR